MNHHPPSISIENLTYNIPFLHFPVFELIKLKTTIAVFLLKFCFKKLTSTIGNEMGCLFIAFATVPTGCCCVQVDLLPVRHLYMLQPHNTSPRNIVRNRMKAGTDHGFPQNPSNFASLSSMFYYTTFRGLPDLPGSTRRPVTSLISFLKSSLPRA